MLAGRIESYIKQGIEPAKIVLVGFSRGAAISILTTNSLKNREIRTIILAGCAKWLQDRPDIQAYGAYYSIYELSDRVGSCQNFVGRSPNIVSFKEIELNTGKEHGAFYQPLQEWVLPVKAWILGRS